MLAPLALSVAVACGAWVQAADPPHPINVAATAERTAPDGTRWTLTLAIDVPEGLHLYAEDGAGFEAASVKIRPESGAAAGRVTWPVPVDLLFALSQPVKVFEGRVEATFALEVSPRRARELRAGRAFALAGTLRYQACTDDACYRARDLEVVWRLSATTAAARPPSSSRRR